MSDRLSQVIRPGTPPPLQDFWRDYSRYSVSGTDLRSHSNSPGQRTRPAEIPSLLRTTTKNPVIDSQADLEKGGYPADTLGLFESYFIGDKGFILYTNEMEPDDNHHLPADVDNDVYKVKWLDNFHGQSVCSAI